MSKKTLKTTSAVLFVPLTKVDEVKRTVTGIVTKQVLDKSGEIFDYESSVPYFKAWSAGFEAVTKGKSLGNVRAMHQPNAVGKVIEIDYDDEEKQITATAKIVDDAEWAKVQEGVYTGFSIGGRYVKQWEEEGQSYFTADPVEISIVDNPCVPVAHFLAVKADGVQEQRNFKLYEPTNEEIATKAAELAGKDGDWTKFLEEARTALKTDHGIPEPITADEVPELPEGAEAILKADATEEAEETEDEEEEEEENEADVNKESDEDEDEEAGEAEKTEGARNLVKQVWQATDGQSFASKAECVAHQATVVQDSPVDPLDAALDKANRVLAGEEVDGSEETIVEKFPVDSELHIRASWVFANKATFESDDEKIKTLEEIRKAWEENIGGVPPSAETIESFLEQKAGEAVKSFTENELEKSLWLVGLWSRVIDEVLWASDCTGWCNEDSDLPASTKTICAALLTFMVDLVGHEVGQAMAQLDKADTAPTGALAKFLHDTIEAVEVPEPVENEVTKALAVEKARGDDLQKKVDKAVDGIEALTAEIEKLKKEPEPRRHPTGKVVDKAEDRHGINQAPQGEDADLLAKMIEKHGQQGVAMLLVKAAQQNPQSALDRK